MKKASCRRSEEEKKIHDKAVSLRKMTDAQLVEAIKDNAAYKSKIAALEQEKQELTRRVENAEKGEAANAKLTVQALNDLDSKKAELKDLRKKLAEVEEKAKKTTAVSSVPPEPKVDIRGGIRRWLSTWGINASGIGKVSLANLKAVLDGTPEVDLDKCFEGEE